jgi:thiosulfate reductase cytochrome b subunit
LRLGRAVAGWASATVFILVFLSMLVLGASVGISLGGVVEHGWEFSWLMLGCFLAAMLATAASWARARKR